MLRAGCPRHTALWSESSQASSPDLCALALPSPSPCGRLDCEPTGSWASLCSLLLLAGKT